MLLRGLAIYDIFRSLVTTLLVECPSLQWQPDGLTIHAKKWFLGAGFQGAPPISLTRDAGSADLQRARWCPSMGVAYR